MFNNCSKGKTMSVGWIHTVTDAVSTLCPHPLESPYFHAAA